MATEKTATATPTTAKVKHPDDLLENLGRSIMFKAMVWSIIGHVVFTAATSVPLFKDWTVYGIKAPTTINAIRTEENRKKEEEERRAKAAAKAEAEAKAQAEAAAKAAEEAKKGGKKKTPAAAAPATGDGAQAGAEGAAAQAAEGEGGAKKPPEVQPLPPKKDFEYGDDLSLD